MKKEVQVTVQQDNPFLKNDDGSEIKTRIEKSQFLTKHYLGLLFIFFFAISILLSGTLVDQRKSVKSCSAKDEDRSREILASKTHLQNEKVLIISDLELPCFPRAAFSRSVLDLSSITDLRFDNVKIDLIDENAFSLDIGFKLGALTFENSKIGILGEQEKKNDSITLENSEVFSFPSKFPVDELSLILLESFEVSNDFVSFLSSSEKSYLSFEGFITDEILENINSIMEDQNKVIHLVGDSIDSYSTLRFFENSFNRIPHDMFQNSKFKYSGLVNKILFEDNFSLEDIPEETFRGHGDTEFYLSFKGCENLTEIPHAVRELNFVVLDLSDSGIIDLGLFEFEPEDDFILNLENTVVEPFCEEIDEFRANLSIPEYVDIETFIYS
eukprot:snap_masked-scaffold_11-processed-gene-7.37-mRNA-1 protein AED:1.00 eAED:1.00 QI:0/0/0/0/1/1/2/0/384